MVTQPGDPNNKSKPAYKKYCTYCHKSNHGVSNCYQKQRDEEYQKLSNPRPRTPQQSFDNTSVVNPAILKITILKTKLIILPETTNIIDIVKIITIIIDIEIMIDTEVTAEIIHKTIIDLILDKDTTVDLKVHIHPDLDMTTTIKEDLQPDPHIDHHTETLLTIDIILDQDIDLALNRKEIPLDNISIHIDLHPNQKITDHNLEHLHKIDNRIESIKETLNLLMTKIVLNLKYIHVK